MVQAAQPPSGGNLFAGKSFTKQCPGCRAPITYVDGKITEGCVHFPASK